MREKDDHILLRNGMPARAIEMIEEDLTDKYEIHGAKILFKRSIKPTKKIIYAR